MQALDPLLYHAQVHLYIDKLMAVDPMRKQYYTDLSTKHQSSLQIKQRNVSHSQEKMLYLCTLKVNMFVYRLLAIISLF